MTTVTATANPYANTLVPEPVLTPESMKKYQGNLKVRPTFKTNQYNGKYLEVYVDDGKPRDRPVEFELVDLYSRFGAGSITDEKTKNVSWSIAFPLMRNGEQLADFTSVCDQVAQREVSLHWAKLFGAPHKNPDLIPSLCQPTAKVPADPGNLEKYGTTFKMGINEHRVKCYIEGKPCTLDEIKGRAGFYTVRGKWEKIYFMVGNAYGNVFKASHIYFEPEREVEQPFMSKSVLTAKMLAEQQAAAAAAMTASSGSAGSSEACCAAAGGAESGDGAAPSGMCTASGTGMAGSSDAKSEDATMSSGSGGGSPPGGAPLSGDGDASASGKRKSDESSTDSASGAASSGASKKRRKA